MNFSVFSLDDFLFFSSMSEGVLSNLSVAVSLLDSSGFIINWAKSVSTLVKLLSLWELWLIRLICPFCSRKRESFWSGICVKRLCMEANTVSLSLVASIWGNFNWAIHTIPFAQSHYRSMQRFYISESKRAHGDLSASRVLPLEFIWSGGWRF